MKKLILFPALLMSHLMQAQVSDRLIQVGLLDSNSIMNSFKIDHTIPDAPGSISNGIDINFARLGATSAIHFINCHAVTGGTVSGYVTGINWPNMTSGNLISVIYSLQQAGNNKYHLALQGDAPSYTNGAWSIGAQDADASAMLDVTSTTKGTRPAPTMTETQQNAISSPATGLMVYNSTVNKYKMYDGSNWVTLNAPNVVTTAATTLIMSKNVSDYVFTGSTSSSWTLPAVASTVDLYRIKNRGSANVTINSNSGNEIYSTSAVSSIVLTPGAAVTLVPDGTYFNVE